ncbi:MAG: inovirus-type Gp2 protein [Campylobacterales bacterium]|nr:inovirus-type Gp2 protein [Campylobacterales bacterium]
MVNSKNINKRIHSTKEYINELQANYSKLNIVRVDLAYKKPHSNNITLEDANSDLERMFNNMRSKPSIFKDKIGYICKREYTQDKGVHFHTVFIYDGQKVQKDVFKAEQIGKYWNQLTDNKGSYHNCNRNIYELNGVGMLDHSDSDKRKILDENVISYLCKDEQTIEPIKENKKDRAFTRGTIPKSKGNIGRPRG